MLSNLYGGMSWNVNLKVGDPSSVKLLIGMAYRFVVSSKV